MASSRFIFPFLLLLTSSCLGDFNRGESYFNHQQYQKAIRELNMLLFFNMADIKALHLRTRSFEELEEYYEAINDYKQIIHLDPKNAMAYAGIGKVYWEKKDYLHAERYLLRAAAYD